MTERNPKFIMPEDAPIVCKACGGTLRPVYEFVQAYLEDFRKMLGAEPKKSDKWCCLDCGFIYDSDFINTGNKIEWLEPMKVHYKNE
jgi:hypothetical protein